MAKASRFRRLRKLVVFHNIQLLVVCETYVRMSLAEEFRARLKFDFVVSHSEGLLWVFYNAPFSCSIVGEGGSVFVSVYSPPVLGELDFFLGCSRCYYCGGKERSLGWLA